MQPIDSDYVLPAALIEVISWASLAIGVLVAVGYAFFLRDCSFLLFIAFIIGMSTVIWAMGERREGSRFLLAIFFAAFGLRLLSTILFHNAGRITGDAFSGSPDAWNYDRWANRAVDFWLHGEFPALSRYYLTGTWDVGFYYILAGTYLVFGESPLVGRVLVVLFGALAALVFYLVARELVGERAGRFAGVVYAYWPVSILWSGYSILRDSLVWFLLLLSTLLVLRVINGARIAAVSLLATLVVLRFVRSYAEFIIVFGVGVAALLWLLHRDRRFVRPAVTLLAVIVAVEGIVAASGGPSVWHMTKLHGAAARQYALKSLPEPTLPPQIAVARSARPRIKPIGKSEATTGLARTDRPSPPPPNQSGTAAQVAAPVLPSRLHLTGPGLLSNSIRFFFGPFAWTADVPDPGNWQLPAMWFWYAILPAALCGLFLGLRERPAMRVIFVTSLILLAALVVAGRGDSYRHREMITPIVILGLVLSIGLIRRHKRPFVLLYVVYLAGLTVLIVYHRHTLKQRGMIATIQSEARIAGCGREMISAVSSKSVLRRARFST